MEPLFISNFKHSKELYIEMNKRFTLVSRTVLGTVFLVAFISLAALYYFYFYETITSVVFVFLGIIWAVYPLISIRIHAKKREKQYIELFGKMPEAQNLFYDDYILSTGITDKSEIKIDYSKIIKVMQSKNLYLLIMNKKLVIMVDKNLFEKGTCKEFEKFIKEKAVNAKIKL